MFGKYPFVNTNHFHYLDLTYSFSLVFKKNAKQYYSLKVYSDKFGSNVVEVVNELGIEGIEDKDFGIDSSRKSDAVDQLDAYARDVTQGYHGRAMASSSNSSNGKAMASDREYGQRICRLGGNIDTTNAATICDENGCRLDNRGKKSWKIGDTFLRLIRRGKGEKSDNNANYSKETTTKNASTRPAVSRYNADTSGTDVNRSEGKVLILATVHDTFPRPSEKRTFWLSFDSLDTALDFRREVILADETDLPLSAEYLDRDAFDIIDEGGRIGAAVIKTFGMTSVIVGWMWDIKIKIGSMPFRGADTFVDKLLHTVNGVFPETLPTNLMEVGKRKDHHVAIAVGEFGGGEMKRFLKRVEEFSEARKGVATGNKVQAKGSISVLECREGKEADAVDAFRAVAAPAFRTWCVGNGVQGYSVDYVLPVNDGTIPALCKEDDTDNSSTPLPQPLKRMRYSHFGCNVVHEDIAYAPGVDVHAAKYALKRVVESQSCGGRLPAEHGHGTEYVAPQEAKERWMRMDPLNVMNPGIGGLSDRYRYGS